MEGYPWDVLDVLHQRGLISDPQSKAKSVVRTDEGLDRAEAAFDRLLSNENTAPPPSGLSVSTAPASRLSELQTILVERSLTPICAPHPDPEVASQMRRGYRIENYSVILFESRPVLVAEVRTDPTGIFWG